MRRSFQCPAAVLLACGLHAAPLTWTQNPGYRFATINPTGGRAGFTAMVLQDTGVSFTNRIPPERHYTNQILLNGSGVAAGDIDSDGWCDLFFAGIGGGSALYRNRGDWRFEDVTKQFGLEALSKIDATGTALADLDGDGDLDLIVNSAGQGTHCFWNDGHGWFGAPPLVLNPGRCGSSLALADIDGDGALDLYIANYRTSTIRDQPGAKFTFQNVNGRPVPVAFGGRPLTDPDLTNRFTFVYKEGATSVFHDELGEPDVLYRNQGKGQFAISPLEEKFDWGLSVMMRDFNGDGAPDIYVCNDFATPDRFWINDGKGRFKAAPITALRQTSLSTMAIDVADINRDGFDDIFTADMFSRERWRRLVQKNESNPNMYLFVETVQQPQSPRNALQLARGDGTYAEIAQLAGLEAAEWAWASIFLDVDLDGYEDLLVANGFERDYMNMDANRKITAIKARAGGQMPPAEHFKLNQYYPRLATPNAAFHNLHNLRFADVSVEWHFDIRAVSQGMCLADLDNDGDLDVIINNSNDAAVLFRNDTPAPRVGVRLKGRVPNTRGIGAKIKLLNGPVPAQTQEMISGGRYLSSDDTMRVFAAGTNGMTIEVTWRSGVRSVATNVMPNRIYEIQEVGLPSRPSPVYTPSPMFKDVSTILGHSDTNSPTDEFARQPLLPNKLGTFDLDVNWSGQELQVGQGVYHYDGKRFQKSPNAPALRDGPTAIADLDGDREVEIFIGSRYASNRWPESGVSQLLGKSGARWTADAGLVRGAVFSDIDGDGDSDLVLACEWGPIRVFRNDRGVLTEVTAALGFTNYIGWWNGVAVGDFDGDGRVDLIASNWGRNTKYERYRSKPLRIVYGDFNGNGSVEQIEACYDESLRAYAPILNIWSLSRGLPWLLEKFGSYEAFSRATIEQALGDRGRQAKYLEANWLDSTLFLNRGNHFEARPLPLEAQMSPAFSVCVADFDGDGNEDVFLAQNFFGTRAETSRSDAGRGLLLRGDGHGNFTAIHGQESGLLIYGEQRGAAAGDYDGDGRVDLVVTQLGAETRLYHNETARPGLRVRLRGQAVGAILRLKFGKEWGPAREVHDRGAVTIMTGSGAPTSIQVRWPGGKLTETEVPAGAREITVARE